MFSLNYFPSPPLDQILERKEADARENGLANLCKDLIEKGESSAKVALDIVTEWLSFQGSCRISGTTVTVSSSLEAAGLDEKYTQMPFWESVFSEECNSPEFWRCLFKDHKYKDIVDGIPDDRVCRMVFHFVHQWQDKLGSLLVDKNVSDDLKVTVLKKQIENIVFFGRNICSGTAWHMLSLPDESLRQALASPGGNVLLRDQEGKPLRDIQGRKMTATAHCGISSSSGDGPRPDDLDKNLYKRIRHFAEKKTGEEIPDRWTLVRCRFRSQMKETRCYAFSGSKPEKQLNKIPMEFWKQHKDDDAFLDTDRDIYVVDVVGKQFGQRVLLSVFEALLPSIKTDLSRLTKSICFEEHSEAQELILYSRSDLTVVDYGEYYDSVISKLNYYDDCIKKAVTNYLTKQSAPGSDVKSLVCKHMWCHISVGSKNKNFQPKTEGLKELLTPFVSSVDSVDKTVETVATIAQWYLTKLQDELEELPNWFLTKLQEKLQQAQCGEDNVLCEVLSKMLDNVDVFLDSRVDFVAMDHNSMDGKPFCKVCFRKVRFFSILPFVLRNLGLTGKDICNQKLSDLFL